MQHEFRDHLERMLKADKDLLLGYLVWYSVSGVRVSHNDAIRHLVNAGIDTNLPLPPKDQDVFRRVCTQAERKRVPTSDPDVYENYQIRDLNADADKVYRRIVGEKVDAKGKRLGYEQLYDLFFDKKSGVISVRKLGPSDAVAEQIVEDVKNEFKVWQGCLNSYAMREWIRHFILGLNATLVRPGGGIYFVSTDKYDKIVALEEFTKNIAGAVEFHYLPLIDDGKQREMLQRAYEAETADEIDALLAEISEIRSKGRRITNDRYEGYLRRYHELMDRTTEYSELLEETLSTTKSRLAIYMRAMLELTEKHVRLK